MDTVGAPAPGTQESALLRKLARLARIGAWELDLESGRLFWTDEMYRLVEVDAATFVPTRERALAFFPGEVQSQVALAMQLAIERGTPWDLEVPLLTARGRSVWVRARGEPESRDARCVRLAGTLEDVTEARRARDTLRARTGEARRLALLAEHTSDLVLITDAQQRIEWVNASFEQVTGYAAADVIGRTPTAVLNRADTETLPDSARLRDHLGRGLPFAGAQLKLYRKDGSAYWVELEQRPVRDETGAITHFIHIQRDVTARREAQQRELELAHRLRLITSSTRIGAFERDLDSGVGLWDDETFRLLGFTPAPQAPPLGALLARIHPDDRGAYQAYLDDVARGSMARDIEYRVQHDDGRIGHVHERGSAERAGTDRRLVIGVVFDLTEQRVAERQALAAAEQLALAVGATGIGFVVLGDGTTWQCDAQASRLLGFEPQPTRVPQRVLESMVVVEDRPVVERLRAERVLAEGPAEVSFRIVRRDGKRRWVRARCAPAPAGAGSPRVLGILTDITEEKQRELLQQLQQERLGLVASAAGFGTWEFDLVDGSAVWSEQMRALYGLPAEAPVPSREQWRRRFVHPDDQARTQARAQWSERTHTQYDDEFRIVRADGVERWIYTRAVFVDGSGGEHDRVLGVSIDISERKHAEARARDALARLEMAATSAGIGTYVHDTVTGQRVWDNAMFRLFGLPPQEEPPDLDAIVRAVHPDDRALYLQARRAALEESRPTDMELRVVLPDGAVRWLHLRGDVQRAEDGGRPRMAGVVFDVTERKLAELRADVAVDLLRLTASQVGLGLWQRDPATGQHEWDAQMRAILGLAADAPLPSESDYLAMVVDEDRARVIDSRGEVPPPGEFVELEHRVRRPDGEVRHLLSRKAAQYDPGGRPVRVYGVTFDVTEARRSAEALRQALARLELATSGAGVGVFSRDLVSHEAHWDAQTFRLFGFEPAGAAPDWPRLLAAVFRDDRERYARILAHAAAEGGFPDTELRVVHPGGAIRHLLVRGRTERDGAGRIARLAGVVIDITERKVAEQRATEYGEWLRLATESVGIGFAQRDLASGVGKWSEQSKRLYGLPEGAGTPTIEEFLARLSPADRARTEQVLKHPPPAGQTTEVEIGVRTVDGQLRRLLIRFATGTDEQGRPTQLYAAAIDVTESRASADRLTAALRRLELATTGSAIGIFERELDREHAYWSRETFALWGLAERQHAPGWEELLALVHPDDRTHFESQWAQLRTSTEFVDSEFRVVHPDGTEVWLLTRGRLDPAQGDRPARVIGVALDITLRKRAERRATEMAGWLGLATRSVGIGLWYRDFGRDRPVWDAQTFRIFGLDPADGAPSDEQWLAMILEEDRAAILAVDYNAPPPRTTLPLEYRIRRPDGELRYLQSRSACLCDTAGRPVRVFGAVFDVTESRAATAALSVAQGRLALAAEAGGIASWECNLQTGEARWDPLLFRFYGLQPTARAPTFGDVIQRVHPDDRGRFERDWQRVLDSDGTVEWEARVVREDGSVGHLITRARAERGADGRPVRVVGATLDVSNLRRTSRRLQEALERLRLAGEAGGIGTWQRDLVTGASVWDANMYRLYGLGDVRRPVSPEQAIALVHPEDRSAVVAAWKLIRETDLPVEFEYRVVQPDGAVRHLTTRGRLQRSEDGQPWRVTGATIDVTHARRTAEELRAALEHLRLVGETAGIGTWERDLVTGAARWDPVMLRLWGLDPDGPAPDRAETIRMIHPDDRAKFEADWQHMLQVDHTIDFEYRVVRPDASVAFLNARGRVERDADGRAVRVRGATIDVTASRAAQRQLREFDEWLRLAGATTGIGFFLHPVRDGADFHDAQLRRIFGFSDAEGGASADYLERVVPEDRELLLAARRRAVDSDAPVESEFRVRLPDGSLRFVLTRRSLQRDEKGRPLHVSGIALDVTESRRAARELRAANERLQLATATARIGIWEQDLVRGDMVWDERQRAIYGVDADWRPDFERWLALVAPEDRTRLREIFAHPAASGTIEYRIVRPDGAERLIVENFTLEADATGTPLRLLGTNLDITDMRAAQRERDALAERMQIIAETVGVGVWDWDPASHTSAWNDRMYELFGHTRESFGDRKWLDVVHPDDVPAAEAAIRTALEGGGNFDTEFRVIWPDGTVRWIASRGRAVRDPGGATRMLGVNVDISERRRSEQATRDLLERMRLTTTATGIGLWEVDLVDRTVHWDEQLFRLVGRAPADLPDLAAAWPGVLHPDDVALMRREQQRAVREQRALDVEVRVILPDGSLRYLTLRGQLTIDAAGRPVRQYGVAFDVTERKLAESALRAKETAERASQAKTEFLSRMSHELRTPLNAILGFTQILEIDQTHPLAPVQRDRIQHIQQAGWHLLSLINEILDLSRIESGKTRLSMAIVPLADVIDECLALVANDAARRGIETVAFRRADAPGSVWADRVRVKQVLLNLLSNAIKYNREGGSVRVSLGADVDGNALVAVRDTGHGLSALQIDQLFQPFNRLGLESAPIEGTGIGLALSLKLVEQMGGRLEVSSEPGVGTEFRVTLPVATPSAERSPEAAPGGEGARAPRGDVRGSLLYVEDNPANVTVVEQMLALRPQVKLFSAPDGATARVLAAVCQPDLILLDMRLPDTDGFALFRELRAQPETCEIPCVGVSANALPSDAAHARNAGFVDYWTKPLEAGQFLRGVDALLGGRAR